MLCGCRWHRAVGGSAWGGHVLFYDPRQGQGSGRIVLTCLKGVC